MIRATRTLGEFTITNGGQAAGAVLSFIPGKNYGPGGQIMNATGGGLLALAPYTGPAAPFVAIAGAVTTLLGKLGIGSGCGKTCVLSSQYANQAEQIFEQNIYTYFAQPAPRAKSAQAAALANFDAIWADFVKQCSDPSLGDAGKRAISDRQSGSTKWTQPANKVPPWGTPAAGEPWNWFSGYRDPIANDATVDDALAPFSSATGGLSTDVVLAAALVAVAIFL